MWDFEKLFLKHAREIDRFLRRRGHSPESAADLTQDTFLRSMTGAPQAAIDNPRAYLHKVAQNLSVDLYRREARHEHVNLVDKEFLRIADLSPSQETVTYDRQRLEIVENALEELPETTRKAFEMHRMGSMTLKEVAAELGLSTSRTWTLVRRAYLHLRERLEDAAD